MDTVIEICKFFILFGALYVVIRMAVKSVLREVITEMKEDKGALYVVIRTAVKSVLREIIAEMKEDKKDELGQ